MPLDNTAGLYTERIASHIVANNWLRGALACVSLVAIALAIADYRISQSFSHLKPLVIRISDADRPRP